MHGLFKAGCRSRFNLAEADALSDRVAAREEKKEEEKNYDYYIGSVGIDSRGNGYGSVRFGSVHLRISLKLLVTAFQFRLMLPGSTFLLFLYSILPFSFHLPTCWTQPEIEI